MATWLEKVHGGRHRHCGAGVTVGQGQDLSMNYQFYLRKYVITIIPEDWTDLDPMYLAVDLSVSKGRLFSTRMHDCVVVQVVMMMSPGKI